VDGIEGPRRGLLGERVARQIERYIADNGLQPGDRLPAGRELTERFGVSRTVVRDAIAILDQRGLVESRPGSGVYVRDGGSEAVSDVLGQMLRRDAISLPELMEARELLEIRNAPLAAERATDDDLARMAAAIEAMTPGATALRFVEADVAFHEAVAAAAGNRVLAAFLQSLRPLLLRGMIAGPERLSVRETSLAEHRAILDAVRGRDPEAARERMRTHLRSSYQAWLVGAGALAAGEDRA
jgi:GntR family transcriptional regulator, transcriptional repressor for pyruvate dehydrogenase complex